MRDFASAGARVQALAPKFTTRDPESVAGLTSLVGASTEESEAKLPEALSRL
jgi:hypothetical protein